MDLISEIVERAKANKQRIVLPEGTEERTTLQNLYYFWFKVCKKRMLLNTKQDVSLTLRSFQ